MGGEGADVLDPRNPAAIAPVNALLAELSPIPVPRVLRTAALGYPEAYEDHPWGDTVYKVKGKIFTFLGATAEGFGISVKLPLSNSVALMLPFVEPTGYGLGKSGWVSLSLEDGPSLPPVASSCGRAGCGMKSPPTACPPNASASVSTTTGSELPSAPSKTI